MARTSLRHASYRLRTPARPLLLKVLVAATVLAILLASCSASNNMTDSAHGLSMSEFTELLESEVIREFGDIGPEAEERWQAAAAYEWKMAHKVERQSRRRRRRRRSLHSATHSIASGNNVSPPGVSPFIACHRGLGKSGGVRMGELKRFFGVRDLGVIANTQHRSCFFLTTTASRASSRDKPPHVYIHPIVPEMKLENIQAVIDRPYTRTSDLSKAAAFDEFDDANDDGPHDMERASPSRFSAMFCPEFPATMEMAKAILTDIQADVSDVSNRRRLRSRTSTRFLRLGGKHKHTTPAASQRFSRSLWNGFDTPSACDAMFDGIQVNVVEDTLTVDLQVDPDSLCHDFSQECLHSLVAALAARRELCTVEALPDMLAMNQQAQWISQSGTSAYRPLFAAGLTGRDQVVAVSDTGLDTDSCYFYDWVLGNTPRTDIESRTVYSDRRKVVQYVGFVDGSDATNGHGTHVVGTLVGRQATTDNAERTGPGDGVARDAKVAFFDIGNSNEGLVVPGGMSNLLEPGRVAGAHIHSASWGSDLNSYTSDARGMDYYMAQHPDFLVVVAAGNRGDAPFWSSSRGTIGSPGTFKNGIAVGASQSEGPDGGSRGKDYLSSFSSRGPTSDGRRKPDMTAPGQRLRSAAANAGLTNAGSDCGTLALEGTSMAAPVVAGSAALIRQYYEQGFYPTGSRNIANARQPSAALVKATLLNGAVALRGVARTWWGTASSSEYDDNQGYGRINVWNSVPLAGHNTFTALVEDSVTLSDGQSHTYTLDIDTRDGACQAREIRVTLVWTDPAASSGCASSCLINDLDLTVSRSSTVLYPNGRSSRDTVNNVERIRTSASHGNRFVVTVRGTNLIRSQDYALIATGCLAGTGGGASPPPPPPPTPTPPVPTPTPPVPTPTPPVPTPPRPVPTPPAPSPPPPSPPSGGGFWGWWCRLFGC